MSEGREERGRVPLDDISAVIAHAHGTIWSNNTFVRLSERNAPVVLCGQNHAPVACVWPIDGHHTQAGRMATQAAAGKPLKKRLWQLIVRHKIRMQARALSINGKEAGGFDYLVRKVRSGDPENIEAQAARRYWPALLGPEFRRDVSLGGTNALLNYGYTVLRAIVSRSICASGLHPTLGVHHSNRANPFALSDDLMEPYRPLIDQAVVNLLRAGTREVTPEAKAALASLTSFDICSRDEVRPLYVQIQRFTHSVAQSFEQQSAELELPDLPDALAMSSLGNMHLETNG